MRCENSDFQLEGDAGGPKTTAYFEGAAISQAAVEGIGALCSSDYTSTCCTWGGTTGVDHAVAVNSWGTRLIWPGPLGTCGSGATSDRGSQTVLSVSDDMAPLHDQHASLFTPLFCSLHGVTGVRCPVSLRKVQRKHTHKSPSERERAHIRHTSTPTLLGDQKAGHAPPHCASSFAVKSRLHRADGSALAASKRPTTSRGIQHQSSQTYPPWTLELAKALIATSRRQ